MGAVDVAIPGSPSRSHKRREVDVDGKNIYIMSY
jgi:hypothetical protein